MLLAIGRSVSGCRVVSLLSIRSLSTRPGELFCIVIFITSGLTLQCLHAHIHTYTHMIYNITLHRTPQSAGVRRPPAGVVNC